MEGRGAREQGWARPVIVVLVAVGLGLLAREAFGVEPPPGKMEKQIEVMERILDQVLIDSPNFLVSGRGNARGLWVPEFGVIMTFDASLVDKDKDWKFDFGKGFKIETDSKGRKVIILDEDGKVLTEDEKGDATKEEVRKALQAQKSMKTAQEGSPQDRLYKRGKAEIVDALLDYGDTLSTIPAGKWLAIVAFLKDARYFDERGLSRLVLKAKIDDLRAYASDKLTEQEMVKRIVEEEY